jgi:glycosyltransferase involved in cell wall biosynthesis
VRDGGRRRLSPVVPALGVESSGSFFEELGAGVVHFPYQAFSRCGVPTVYNPHDLQFVHFPEFAAPERVRHRRTTVRAACRLAAAVAAESRQTAEDVVEHCGVGPSKVLVVHRGSPLGVYREPTADMVVGLRRRLGGADPFALYPAQTWPHKNHIGLAGALRVLRDRDGTRLTVVCTGRQNEFFPEIRAEARRLGVDEQLRFLGYVEAAELRALYGEALLVVVPSLFEGGGFPLLEAFEASVPVACSHIPALAEYAGDAALLFDPRSPEGIADALARLVGDGALRERLVSRGRERSRAFTWRRTALTYRALYRRLAGRSLSDEDRELLAASAFRPKEVG